MTDNLRHVDPRHSNASGNDGPTGVSRNALDVPTRHETNVALGWEDVRDLESGTIRRRITDNTQPGGPVLRHIEYIAPFTRCDRERDYRVAWEAFDSRIAVM